MVKIDEPRRCFMNAGPSTALGDGCIGAVRDQLEQRQDRKSSTTLAQPMRSRQHGKSGFSGAAGGRGVGLEHFQDGN